MYITINIPFHKVTFQVRVEEVKKKNQVNLEQAAKRQALARRIETEISCSRELYSMMR